MIRIPYNSFDYYKESIENKENLSLDKFNKMYTIWFKFECDDWKF